MQSQKSGLLQKNLPPSWGSHRKKLPYVLVGTEVPYNVPVLCRGFKKDLGTSVAVQECVPGQDASSKM